MVTTTPHDSVGRQFDIIGSTDCPQTITPLVRTQESHDDNSIQILTGAEVNTEKFCPKVM